MTIKTRENVKIFLDISFLLILQVFIFNILYNPQKLNMEVIINAKANIYKIIANIPDVQNIAIINNISEIKLDISFYNSKEL